MTVIEAIFWALLVLAAIAVVLYGLVAAPAVIVGFVVACFLFDWAFGT